jgi:hypothetical protein
MFTLAVLRVYLEQMVQLRKRGVLSSMGDKYCCPEELVLLHGRRYTPQPFPKVYRRGIPQACFENAYRLALNKSVFYVEGFAARCGPIPVLHAWCVEPESSLVLDPTWVEEPGMAYFGVPIRLEFRKTQGGSVLDNWRESYPILQSATAKGDWKVSPSFPALSEQ